jgi:excisionase family DNA binding protein
MSNRTHEPAGGPTLYSISTVAARLDLSQDSVRRLIRNGELTPIRIGATVRIDAAELESFLDRQRQAAGGRTRNTDFVDTAVSPGRRGKRSVAGS